MVKDSILFKIFSRYLKEKGWFNEYKKCIPNTYFTTLETRSQLFPSSLLAKFKITDGNYKYKHNISEINRLFGNNDNIMEFNTIINAYLKDYCISFFKEYDLIETFTEALIKCKNSTRFIYIIPDYQNIHDKKCQYEIFNAYLDAYLKKSFSLFNFINYAFTWNSTKNGHKYWYDMHELLKNYLWDKLLKQKK